MGKIRFLKMALVVVFALLASFFVACSGGGGSGGGGNGGGGNIDNSLVGIWAENTPEAGYFFEFFSDGKGIEHYIDFEAGRIEQIPFEWWVPSRNQICIIGEIEFDGCNSYDIRNGDWIFKGGIYQRVNSLPTLP
ncbi:MAG: hypothetical protein FWE23_06200 [Chitinivibrionia bacterium]|nr:hypothetical protein [Chitinivibrionia bacterium]